MESDKNLATLAMTINFPWPEELVRAFRVLGFWVPLLEVLITTFKSHINTCNFGSLEMKPTPILIKDWRIPSLISPTDIDSIEPCKIFNTLLWCKKRRQASSLIYSNKNKITNIEDEPFWTWLQYPLNISIHQHEI